MYTDDSCVIVPSPSGLQKLLNICIDSVEENSIIYNDKKSKYRCFMPKSITKLSVPHMYLNEKKTTLNLSH